MFYDYTRAGSYAYHMSEYGNGYYTYNPESLNAIDFINFDQDLALTLARANRAIGLLEGICTNVPSIENINSIILKREAFASCSIDDEIKCSLYELIAPGKELQRKQIVQDCIAAHQYAVQKMSKKSLTRACF